MKYRHQVTIKPNEARLLTKLGFVLKFVSLQINGKDTYDVFTDETGFLDRLRYKQLSKPIVREYHKLLNRGIK